MAERARAAAALAELDLTFTQAHTLRVLTPGEPRSMKDAAADVPVDASTFTGIVDRLERRRLVRRSPSEADRRIKLVSLTAEGEALRKRVLEILATPPAALAALPVADQRTLRDLLRKAAAALPRTSLEQD